MNNKPLNSSKSKRVLYTSLFGAFLAFIIGKVFDPIFEYLYTLFLSLGGSFVTYISDSTYQKISNGFSEQTSITLFYIAVIACTSYLSVFFFSIKSLYHSTNISKNDVSLGSCPDDFSCDALVSIEQLKKDTEDLQKQLEYNKHRIDKLTASRKIDTVMYFLVRLWVVTLMVALFFVYSRNIFINQKIIVMTNNIEIVSPYISDTEYKQLKSDFHTIQCSQDYDELAQLLQDIANDHSITLKE